MSDPRREGLNQCPSPSLLCKPAAGTRGRFACNLALPPPGFRIIIGPPHAHCSEMSGGWRPCLANAKAYAIRETAERNTSTKKEHSESSSMSVITSSAASPPARAPAPARSSIES
eukprot:scaffold144560_cov28-Tisochrysis_lutea.AAC.1